ncbi:MAG: caspase family protein [Bacteroidetes bacterium]|nr:MAG: caspase family protein [Bacteroidota bacterium]
MSKSFNIAAFIIITLIVELFVNAGYSQQPKSNILLKDEEGKSYSLYKNSYALVIGESNYNNGWPKLPGVINDVEIVKNLLSAHSFQCQIAMDPDNVGLRKVIDDFINNYGYDQENRLLIYFAGHGHTIKSSYNEEMGYIVPSNSPNPNRDKQGFMSSALNMQEIEVYAKKIQSKHALFMFDACFSGSIFSLSRAVPENISYKTAKPVRQFITSGSAEETVPDQSVFRDQFAAALRGEADVNRDGYITGSEIGEFLQEKVVNYTRGSQHPQYGKIRNPNLDKGDFVFVKNAGLEDKTNETPVELTTTEAGETKGITQSPITNYTTIQKFDTRVGQLYLMFTINYPSFSYPGDTKERVDYLVTRMNVSRLPLSIEAGAYLSVSDDLIIGPVFNYSFENIKGDDYDFYNDSLWNPKGFDWTLSTTQIGASIQYYPLSPIAQGFYTRLDAAIVFGSVKETGFEDFSSSGNIGFGGLLSMGYSKQIFSGPSLLLNFSMFYRSMPGHETGITDWENYNYFEKGSYMVFSAGVGVIW